MSEDRKALAEQLVFIVSEIDVALAGDEYGCREAPPPARMSAWRHALRAAAEALNEESREIAELRGIIKKYGDNPDYARSRFAEIDLLHDQRAHDKLKIAALEKRLEALSEGPVATLEITTNPSGKPIAIGYGHLPLGTYYVYGPEKEAPNV